jgi:hypothetical protein
MIKCIYPLLFTVLLLTGCKINKSDQKKQLREVLNIKCSQVKFRNTCLIDGTCDHFFLKTKWKSKKDQLARIKEYETKIKHSRLHFSKLCSSTNPHEMHLIRVVKKWSDSNPGVHECIRKLDREDSSNDRYKHTQECAKKFGVKWSCDAWKEETMEDKSYDAAMKNSRHSLKLLGISPSNMRLHTIKRQGMKYGKPINPTLWMSLDERVTCNNCHELRNQFRVGYSLKRGRVLVKLGKERYAAIIPLKISIKANTISSCSPGEGMTPQELPERLWDNRTTVLPKALAAYFAQDSVKGIAISLCNKIKNWKRVNSKPLYSIDGSYELSLMITNLGLPIHKVIYSLTTQPVTKSQPLSKPTPKANSRASKPKRIN